jgi:septal ring factor EnvC (AmiA/AmiB activator)
MSTDIAEHYSKEIERLNTELSKARKEAQALRADRNGKVKSSEEQLIQAKAEVEKLKSENSKLTQKIETLPGELKGEVEKLKGEIRNRDHKTKFTEVAKEMQADPAALEALWKLSEYKPDVDEVDADKIKDVISKTLESNPFMRQARDQRNPIVIPGAGQGQKATNAAGSFTQSYEQGRDPVFQRENRTAIQQAARAGLLTTLGRE